MKIRLAEKKDLVYILPVFEKAKAYMRKNGNHKQWGDDYPGAEVLSRDIEQKQFYVCEQDKKIHAVFAFIIGDDPTYHVIENGAWLNTEAYGTIHRLASDGKLSGVFAEVMRFCKGRIANLRADTHEDNTVMQELLKKEGFKECGIIYVRDGTPRIAYQLIVKEE